MVAASKLAPSTAAQFVAFFELLRKTEDVPERLELLGLATRGPGGALMLRDDVREQLERLEARLKASLAAGMTPREAVEAVALDVDHRKVTHVVYGLFVLSGGPGLYVGETSGTPAKRFEQHPGGCKKLAAAMKETGGKDAWTCAVLLVLPEDARSNELLLYIEARLQRLLDTVGGAHGRNAQYGAGLYGGAPDENRWIAKYAKLIDFVLERGKTPSQNAKDASERTLGKWAKDQRERRDGLSTHRRRALDAIGSAWKWRINASPVTNAIMFEKFRADPRVIASGGVHIPTDIPGVDAQRVVKARARYKSKEMSESDRAIVDVEFPGLKMTAQDASFRSSAEAFAKKYPDAKTFPSRMDDEAMYRWLVHVRSGHIAMTRERKGVLESFGLSKLLETLKPPEVRAATVALRNARNDKANAVDSTARAERREEKRQKKIDDIVAGPPVALV